MYFNESNYRGNEQVATRAHSVLPASVRPSPTTQPASPGDGRTTPRIEPDLVAKDRLTYFI